MIFEQRVLHLPFVLGSANHIAFSHSTLSTTLQGNINISNTSVRTAIAFSYKTLTCVLSRAVLTAFQLRFHYLKQDYEVDIRIIHF